MAETLPSVSDPGFAVSVSGPKSVRVPNSTDPNFRGHTNDTMLISELCTL